MEPVMCYNRGCGKTFVPAEQKQDDDSCLYHPGEPYFHDALKGWTCCSKKSTDFTVFLNFPGCQTGAHSRVKPPEPEKKKPQPVVEAPPPQPPRESLSAVAAKPRPPLDTPLTRLEAKVSPSLKAALEKKPLRAMTPEDRAAEMNAEVKVGESCKNGGCKTTFSGDAEQNSSDSCCHHPGVPIFHEGMKYWSCCQKKTSDFQAFLNQVGCTMGKHCWKKPLKTTECGGKEVTCRHDWHQTPTKMTVAIYCKQYDPAASFIELSPVRMHVHVVFPEQNGVFDWDIELKGMIDVSSSSTQMMGTKIEIQLGKADSVAWASLDVPKAKKVDKAGTGTGTANGQPEVEDRKLESKVDAIDLDDLEVGPAGGAAVLSDLASGGRTGKPVI